MLRFFFWIFLIINGLLLALNLGYLGKWSDDEREPSRMKLEKNADKIKLLSANAAQDLIEAHGKQAEVKLSCVELSGFSAADAKAFDEKLKTLELATRLTRTELSEVANNMVYLPSLGSKDAAEKKAAQLRKLGIAEFYIVQDQSPMRWGISLGVFKTPEAAKAHLANLAKKGLKEAKLAPRTVSSAKVHYRVQELSSDERQILEQLKSNFASTTLQECKAKSD
ncbi:SPOR domain-containing protein [Undibacterium fentianense]|uniref:SPOR domain-containing protein n=1 Tax=Undibacterium fentianense TaxID=2828728 RepID=A0A941E2B5_9BURK|nr:SPOR domain-containing protein [Undibacterium fentianense]MBR7799767.1 SPOR domain-containing protein [Undibacterium fentianense]